MLGGANVFFVLPMLGGVAIFNLFTPSTARMLVSLVELNTCIPMLGGAHFFVVLRVLGGVAHFDFCNTSAARMLILGLGDPVRCRPILQLRLPCGALLSMPSSAMPARQPPVRPPPCEALALPARKYPSVCCSAVFCFPTLGARPQKKAPHVFLGRCSKSQK